MSQCIDAQSLKRSFWFYLFLLSLLITTGTIGYHWVANATSYRSMIIEAFGHKETHRRMMALYELIEIGEINGELAESETDFSRQYGFSAIRFLPQRYVEEVFGHEGAPVSAKSMYIGLVCYDKTGTFVALHFDSSRTGCFVSKDPNLCPAFFDKLYRFTQDGIFITGIDSAGGL